MRRGAWANIPPKRNRNDPIYSVLISTATVTGSSVSSTGSSNAVGLRHATTSWMPTTFSSCSLRQSDCGSALMSPTPWRSHAGQVCEPHGGAATRRRVVVVKRTKCCENIGQAKRVLHARNITQPRAGLDRVEIGRPRRQDRPLLDRFEIGVIQHCFGALMIHCGLQQRGEIGCGFVLNCIHDRLIRDVMLRALRWVPDGA